MRPLLLFGLILFCTHVLSAQDNRWDISTTFSPRLNYQATFPAVNLEWGPMDVPLRPMPGFDTLSIGGTERFFGGPIQGVKYSPIETDFWYAAQVNLHYKLPSGFDFSAGFYYANASYTSRASGEVLLQGIVSSRTPLLYPVAELEERSFGGVLSANYHLFADKKLQPYFGMGLSLLADQTKRNVLGQVYSGDSITFLPATGGEGFTESTSFGINFLARMGLLYQITETWAIGLDFSTRRNIGQGRLGLQVRRKI